MPSSHHFCLARLRNELRRAERDLAHAERALLLERRGQREEERRYERKDLGHGRWTLSPRADGRNATAPVE